jgi:multidrug efflux pump
MAASVAAPLERALGGIAGVSGIYSDSRQGSTSITLEFALGRDLNGAARDVQAAINAARGQLPSGMPGNPTYRKSNPSQAPIMALALSSPNLAPGALYDLAATVLAQKIAQINGVGEVAVGGSSLPAVRVQLNPHALSHNGIALDEVRRAISATNSVKPRGSLDSGDRQWEVQLSGQLRQASEYQSLVIRYRDGAPVRLGDVAKISDSIEDRYSSGFHNDRPAVTLMISRQPGANIIATIDAISEGSPSREWRVPFSICSRNSAGIEACICGVITKPGATALARMFCLPQAEATWRTSASMPALVMA